MKATRFRSPILFALLLSTYLLVYISPTTTNASHISSKSNGAHSHGSRSLLNEEERNATEATRTEGTEPAESKEREEEEQNGAILIILTVLIGKKEIKEHKDIVTTDIHKMGTPHNPNYSDQ